MESRSYLFLLLLCPLIALFTLASSPIKRKNVDKIGRDYYSRHIRDVVVKRERNFATHGVSNLNEGDAKLENNSSLLQLPKQTDRSTKLGNTFKTNIEHRKKRTLCSCEDIDEDCLPECSNPCPCTTAAPTPKVHFIQTPERPPAQNPPVIIPPQNTPPQQNIGLNPPLIQPLTNTVPSNVGSVGLHPGVVSGGLATRNANIKPQSHQAVLLPIPSNPIQILTNPNLNSLNPLLNQPNQASSNFGYTQTSNSGAFSRNQFTNSNPSGLNMVNPGLSGVSQQSYLTPVKYVPLMTANGVPSTYTSVAPLVNPGNQGNFGNQGSSFNSQGQSYGNQGASYGSQPSNSNNLRPNYGNQGSNYGSQGNNYGIQAPNSNSQQTIYGSQGSNYNNQRPNYGSQGPNYSNQGSSNGNQGSNLNQRPNFGNQGTSYGNQATNVNNQGSNVGNQGSSYGNQGSKVNNQGTVGQGSNQGPRSANQESNAGNQAANLPAPNQVPASAIEVPNSLSVNSQSSPNPSNLPGNSGNAGNANPPGSTGPSVATNPQPQTPAANQAHNPFAPGSALSSSKASPTRPPDSNERSAQKGANDVQKNPSVENLHDHEERTTNGKGPKSKSLHDKSEKNLDGKYETKNSGNIPLKSLMHRLLKKLSKYETSFSGGMEKTSLIVKSANSKATSPMRKVNKNLAKQRMKAKHHKGKSASRHRLRKESSKDSTHARKTKYHHRKEAWKKVWKEIEGYNH